MQYKYSVGKYLRKLKNLRKTDSSAKLITNNPQLFDYIEYLKQNDVIIDGLAVSQFQTKNGLPYIGLIATQLLKTNKIFIRVPIKCLLNTKIAYFSDLKSFFDQNPKYFFRQFEYNWQDHILLAFLLYEFKKGKQSQWYHLINNLSRNIDYVIFWNQNQIKYLQDSILQKMIHKQLKQYQQQTKQFLDIASKYPQFFPSDILTEQNVRWIHIHLVSRCFGKFFQYTTMVPFAELLNHECSDVYYNIIYHENNPNKPDQQTLVEQYKTQQELQQIQTSNGSYNSSQFQFEQQQKNIQDLTFQLQEKEFIYVNPVVETGIKDIQNFLYTFINFGDNISLGYLLQIYEILQVIKKTEVSTVIKKIQIHRIQSTNSIYYDYLKKFAQKIGIKYTKQYQQHKKKQQINKLKNIQKEQQGNISTVQRQWPEQKFDEFIMQCSSKDQFQKGSQVYFCYGRLSNRMLLMRYGITLEHNKYNHIYLHLNSYDYIPKQYKQFRKKLKQNKINSIKKFKVKRTKLCIQLITFLRGLEWKLHQDVQGIFFIKDILKQFKVINKCIQIYSNELLKFNLSLQQYEKKLYDPNTGYHQYFATIYVIQKQRIISQQIKLLYLILEILKKYESKHNLIECISRVQNLQQEQESKMNRLMIKQYLEHIRLE